ncbi:hypothetical protein [Streptomyces scabiei]
MLVDAAAGLRPDTAFTRHEVAGIRFGYPAEDSTIHAVRVPSGLPA